MKKKFNLTSALLVVFILFAIVAATPYIISGDFVADEVSGAITYAKEEADTCTDTDQGQDYFTQGRITNNKDIDIEDACVSNNVLMEYYCTSDREVASEYHTCPNNYVCSNGACVRDETYCTDSDGGMYYYDKGTVIRGEETYTDYCDSEIA